MRLRITAETSFCPLLRGFQQAEVGRQTKCGRYHFMGWSPGLNKNEKGNNSFLHFLLSACRFNVASCLKALYEPKHTLPSLGGFFLVFVVVVFLWLDILSQQQDKYLWIGKGHNSCFKSSSFYHPPGKGRIYLSFHLWKQLSITKTSDRQPSSSYTLSLRKGISVFRRSHTEYYKNGSLYCDSDVTGLSMSEWIRFITALKYSQILYTRITAHCG